MSCKYYITIDEGQINTVKEVYHQYPTKYITKEMLMEAHRKAHLPLWETKRILNNYIKTLENND